MGLFANTLFSVLLGWVQTAASWLWSLITNVNVSAWLRWVLDNWLLLLIVLCAAGLVVDFIVYLLRWQPYRVWGRLLRSRTDRQEDEQPDVSPMPTLQRKWLYADGTTHVEDIPVPNVPQQPAGEQLQTPIRPVRRAVRAATVEQAYHQPVYPPNWQQPQHEQGENQ